MSDETEAHAKDIQMAMDAVGPAWPVVEACFQEQPHSPHRWLCEGDARSCRGVEGDDPDDWFVSTGGGAS